MNYIQKIKKELSIKIDIENELLNLYTLLVLTKGVNCTNKDVHNAWSIWENEIMPEHRSLIPYCKLNKLIQDLDTKYCNAIVNVAERLNN